MNDPVKFSLMVTTLNESGFVEVEVRDENGDVCFRGVSVKPLETPWHYPAVEGDG